MAYTITSQCIGCNRCQSICPTDAVQNVNQRYQIDPTTCNNCVGFYNVPQCWAACPTNNGCIPDAATANLYRVSFSKVTTDYWDSWFATYDRMVSRLKSMKQSEYWQHWFDAYSTELLNLRTHHC